MNLHDAFLSLESTAQLFLLVTRIRLKSVKISGTILKSAKTAEGPSAPGGVNLAPEFREISAIFGDFQLAAVHLF